MAVEPRRLCGYRKVGGLYLVAPAGGSACGKLPLEVSVCPCCAQGIKPARGWTWINPVLLFRNVRCKAAAISADCTKCPLGSIETNIGTKAGLLWTGENFYPTPTTFMAESLELGISRRISKLPRDFKLGETWVFLAHRHGIFKVDKMVPSLFTLFKPTAIERIVTDSGYASMTDDERNREYARGISFVIVPDNDQDHAAKPEERQKGLLE